MNHNWEYRIVKNRDTGGYYLSEVVVEGDVVEIVSEIIGIPECKTPTELQDFIKAMFHATARPIVEEPIGEIEL